MKKFIFALVLAGLVVSTFAQKSAIRVEVTGKGSPVIFLPGFGCSGKVWNQMVDALKDEHECHVVTYAGFDGVEAVDTLWLPTIKQSICQYIANKNLKNVTIVGHSIGGTFGLMLSAEPLNQVEKLVVVEMSRCWCFDVVVEFILQVIVPLLR